jgi:hypothetical protein
LQDLPDHCDLLFAQRGQVRERLVAHPIALAVRAAQQMRAVFALDSRV